MKPCCRSCGNENLLRLCPVYHDALGRPICNTCRAKRKIELADQKERDYNRDASRKFRSRHKTKLEAMKRKRLERIGA